MTLPAKGSTIRLRFNSAFEMLDLVQVVSDKVARLLEFEDDALVWMEVAVRESVINAIKHGNRSDPQKQVVVEFTTRPAVQPDELVISIRDQGEGFDPDALPDPLAPENLLKSSGRGIFFMRSFMDDVSIERASEGGMEVRLTKKLPGRT
jgi:serine/threonine-protein kinase RsbW